jgi:LacI family transcriptional regulator
MGDRKSDLPDAKPDRVWRGPTIAEIAKASGVGTATVDRVLNGRDSVREATRKKVLATLATLGGRAALGADRPPRRIAFVTDSGVSFNRTLEESVQDYCLSRGDVVCPFQAVTTADVEPVKLAQMIERAADGVDGLVVVAREDLVINRAMRNVAARRMPVVCLTTDLPNSGRTAYVGSDQTNAGATAAYLMGQVVGQRPGKILLVYSAPYRCQEERELGFKRVLRAEFAHLEVDERVNSKDDTEFVYHNVMRYIADHGAPAGIYNVGAGNVGIGRALQAEGPAGRVIFIGHELNANSRTLLESGLMHFAIGHDVDREVALAIDYIGALLDKRPPPPLAPTRVRIYTKYSCN